MAAAPEQDARASAALPRPLTLVIGGAIAVVTIVAAIWGPLVFERGARGEVHGPTRVGVIVEQIESDRATATVGAPTPDFAWVAPDGTRRTLGALAGRAVVVNFWATWCEPCRREMPLLERAAAAQPETAFLAVDLDEGGNRVRAFFDELGLRRLEPLLDVGLVTTRRYAVVSLPTTFFVGSDGTIRYVAVGEMDERKLANGLARVK
jgi:thiol-disulfide isomerase/thioredoxin